MLVQCQSTRRWLRLALALLFVPAVALGGASVAPLARAASPAPRAAILGVNPPSGLAGSSVTVAGVNFVSATPTFTPTVTIVFADAAGTKTTLGTTRTTSVGGSFSIATTIPSSAVVGPALLTATDVSGTVATAPFDVRPSATHISASPSSGIPGATTTVTGDGFAVGEPIVLSLTQGTTVTILSSGSVTSTGAGAFSANVVIPGNAANGVGTLKAQDQDNNFATTAITVTRAAAPSVGVSPSTAPQGATVTITGTNFAATEPVTLSLAQGPATLATVAGVTTTSAGAFTATASIPSTVATGTVTVTASDRSGNTGSTLLAVAPQYNVANGPTSAYFAEGYTGQYSANKRATFDESLAILNPNPFTATAAITYLIQGENPVAFARSVAPDTTLRESVNADIGDNKTAAAVVTSPSKIYVERVIRRFGPSGMPLDGDSSLGNASLGTTFYFAEGYTGISFQEYLTVANPGSTPAHVTVRFAPQASSATNAPVETFVVPANGRATRNIRVDAAHIANKSVGMIVTSDQPIMAERVLYFGGGGGSGKFGATAKAGIQSLASQYYFAFGSAGGHGLAQRSGDQSFVTVLNPDVSTANATVIAQFVDAGGHKLGTASVIVAPGTRQTIRVNSAIGPTSSVFATILTASIPFAAERPQYFGGSPNDSTHPGVAPSGTPAGATAIAFPDLSLSSIAGEAQQQTVFLYNPTSASEAVTGTYYSASGTRSISYTLNANSITTINVNSDAAGLASGALGAVFALANPAAGRSFVATAITNTADGRSYTGTEGDTVH